MSIKTKQFRIQLIQIMVMIGISLSLITGITLIIATNSDSESSILENAGFEKHSNYHPWPWWRDDCRIYSVSINNAPEGGRVLQTKYIQNGAFNIHQEVNGKLTSNQTYYPKAWVRFYYGSVSIRFRVTTVVEGSLYEYATDWKTVDYTDYQGEYIDGGSIDVGELGNTIKFYMDIQGVHYNSRNSFYIDDVAITNLPQSPSYDIDWGEPMVNGRLLAKDIDAHPFRYENVWAIDTQHKIAWWNFDDSTNKWKWSVFCDLPDYIEDPERLAVVPISIYPEPIEVSLFLVTTRGYVYEMTSVEIGGASEWERHKDGIRAKDIASGRIDIFIINQDGTKIKRYDLIRKKWEKLCDLADIQSEYPDIYFGYMKRIDVHGRFSHPLIITDRGYVLRWDPTFEWEWWPYGRPFGYFVGDIGVGGEVTQYMPYIYALGAHRYGHYKIYQHKVGYVYQKVSGLLTYITVDANGDPWGVAKSGEVFHGVPTPRIMPRGNVYFNLLDLEIKFKDNYEQIGRAEPYGDGWIEVNNERIDFVRFESRRVDDGDSIRLSTGPHTRWWWRHSIEIPDFEAIGRNVDVMIQCSEKDGNAPDDHYGLFELDFYVEDKCDFTDLWTCTGEDSDIRIKLYYSITSKPLFNTPSSPIQPSPSSVSPITLPSQETPRHPQSQSYFPSWRVEETYTIGDIVSYNGYLYECIQSHTAYSTNWTPVNTPALWKRI